MFPIEISRWDRVQIRGRWRVLKLSASTTTPIPVPLPPPLPPSTSHPPMVCGPSTQQSAMVGNDISLESIHSTHQNIKVREVYSQIKDDDIIKGVNILGKESGLR